MLNHGILALPTGVAGLVLGLVVGALGSFTDDALGGGTAATILQVGLWVLGAVILIPALLGLLGGAAAMDDHRDRPPVTG